MLACEQRYGDEQVVEVVVTHPELSLSERHDPVLFRPCQRELRPYNLGELCDVTNTHTTRLSADALGFTDPDNRVVVVRLRDLPNDGTPETGRPAQTDLAGVLRQ